MIKMGKVKIRRVKGSVLVMAVVLVMVITLLGLSFLFIANSMGNIVRQEICAKQAQYDSQSGAAQGMLDIFTGRRNYTGKQEFYAGNYFDYEIIPAGSYAAKYGYSNRERIVGKGTSQFDGIRGDAEIILIAQDGLSFADFLYISHRERDSLRHVIISFWTPDTLDGLVHSNDTIHISTHFDSPMFTERVTTSANYIDPPNNHARFEEGWGYRPPITFPDNIDYLRPYSEYDWGTVGPDSITQLVLSRNFIRMRKCGLRRINNVDSIGCYPATLSEAPVYYVPNSGVIVINGKAWISASRGQVDIMDGEIPERSKLDGGFISDGFSGRLTIASTDTMIITDNLIYEHAKADFSVPLTLDSCADILGLVSGSYIMVGKKVRDTVYIHAAMAAVTGSISVQDIYMNHAPGWDNEKQSLVVYGSLAQRNRGIMHTTDYPFGHLRGFIEKDYHYDRRLSKQAPPHFPMVSTPEAVFVDCANFGNGD